jgi:hypothetical protein
MIARRDLFVLSFMTLIGVMGSGLMGLLAYGGEVLNYTSPAFAFLSFGLSGAFIFAFFHTRGTSEAITVAVVVSTVQFGLSLGWIKPINAVIWSYGVNIPVVVLAFLFDGSLARFRNARFLFIGALYGAGFVALSFFTAWIGGVETMPADVFRSNLLDGVLIGCGLGIGVEAAEMLVRSLDKSSPAHRFPARS